MTRIFISQPMGGKTNQQIREEREYIEQFCRNMYPGCEIIDTVLDDHDVPICKNRPLMFLAKSLEMLADADIAVFAMGWKDARGCCIEHEAAEKYGITIFHYANFLNGTCK